MRTLEQIDAEMKALQEERETVLNAKKVFILWPGGWIAELDENKPSQKEWHSQGNLFPTREAAERERDRRALIQEIREASGFYKPVWDDKAENFAIRCESGAFFVTSRIYTYWLGTIFIANNPADAERILEQFRDRLHLLED